MHLSLNSFFGIKNSDALILSFDEIGMWSMFNRLLVFFQYRRLCYILKEICIFLFQKLGAHMHVHNMKFLSNCSLWCHHLICIAETIVLLSYYSIGSLTLQIESQYSKTAASKFNRKRVLS